MIIKYKKSFQGTKICKKYFFFFIALIIMLNYIIASYAELKVRERGEKRGKSKSDSKQG